VTEYKENVMTKVVNLVLGTSKAANVTAGLMQKEQGNWEVLDHYQQVVEQQANSLDLLTTIASYVVGKNNSLDFTADVDGHLVSAKLCQCCFNNNWTTHWSSWQYDNCEAIDLTNGTIVECGEEGRKTRKRLKDVNLEVWEEEVEEVVCQTCESFTVNTQVCFELQRVELTNKEVNNNHERFLL